MAEMYQGANAPRIKLIQEKINNYQQVLHDIRSLRAQSSLSDTYASSSQTPARTPMLECKLMVPFGPNLMLPASAINVNSFKVLLGESYIAELSGHDTEALLERRIQHLNEKLLTLPCIPEDLEIADKELEMSRNLASCLASNHNILWKGTALPSSISCLTCEGNVPNASESSSEMESSVNAELNGASAKSNPLSSSGATPTPSQGALKDKKHDKGKQASRSYHHDVSAVQADNRQQIREQVVEGKLQDVIHALEAQRRADGIVNFVEVYANESDTRPVRVEGLESAAAEPSLLLSEAEASISDIGESSDEDGIDLDALEKEDDDDQSDGSLDILGELDDMQHIAEEAERLRRNPIKTSKLNEYKGDAKWKKLEELEKNDTQELQDDEHDAKKAEIKEFGSGLRSGFLEPKRTKGGDSTKPGAKLGAESTQHAANALTGESEQARPSAQLELSSSSSQITESSVPSTLTKKKSVTFNDDQLERIHPIETRKEQKMRRIARELEREDDRAEDEESTVSDASVSASNPAVLDTIVERHVSDNLLLLPAEIPIKSAGKSRFANSFAGRRRKDSGS